MAKLATVPTPATINVAPESNIVAKVEGHELVIRVDLRNVGRDSKSGKSMLVGSTGSFMAIAGRGEKFALNVIRTK